MSLPREEVLDVEISPTGEVKVRVRGAGGPACLEYVEAFRRAIGPVVEQELTPEYYETRTAGTVRQRLRGG